MVHGLSPATPTSAATASWWCRKVLLLLVPKRFPANKLRLLSPPSPKTAAEALLATAQALTHTARHTPHPPRRPQTQLADHNIAKHMLERMKFIARCRVLIEIIQALKQNVGFYQRWENRGKTSSKTLSGKRHKPTSFDSYLNPPSWHPHVRCQLSPRHQPRHYNQPIHPGCGPP